MKKGRGGPALFVDPNFKNLPHLVNRSWKSAKVARILFDERAFQSHDASLAGRKGW
jgi:hypothetical protein